MVSGFTIIRNAVRLDYPIKEAILSILPLCDEMIVAVGNSDDNTLDMIRRLPSEKIKIVETTWDDRLRDGGRTLAVETDKAFAAVSPHADWCFYIQADEVLHEKYHGAVQEAMKRYRDNPEVEGLLFDYKHFYGSYDYVGSSWKWYRREIRIIRNDKRVFSYKDAQGFRKRPNEKLRVKLVDATIYHYGWVRDPRAMQQKQLDFNHLYHDDNWIEDHVAKAEEFNYPDHVEALELFEGDHPQVMTDRIARLNWKFDHDISRNRLSAREKLKRIGSRILGYRIGEYKNYRLI